MKIDLPPDTFFRPLFPEDRDQGDPFIFAPPPDTGTRHRYYVYTTGQNPKAGTAIPVFASNDLASWERLGEGLEMPHAGAHWAPCVRHVPGLARPYVMIYSRSIGLGDQAHVGHRLYRADSERPQGPFADSGHILTPNTDFAIDADVYRLPDGALKIAYVVDMVADEPYGTRIVEADIAEALTEITSTPRPLNRPKFWWHLFDARRVLPHKRIPGVDSGRQAVRWHCVEAPGGGLTAPDGRTVYLYSGGCYFDFYAVGALVEDDRGNLRDITTGMGDFVIGPQPGKGFYGPGHCSWLRTAGGRDYLMLHARFGAANARRQMCLVPLKWNDDGLPYTDPMP